MMDNRLQLHSKNEAEKDSAWCLVSIKGYALRAQITHIGRGRFRILNDDSGSSMYVGNIVDASDVFYCREEKEGRIGET